MSATLIGEPLHAHLRNGYHQITGTVDELGVVGAYPVYLLDRLDKRVLRKTWSDATTGAYSFEYLAYVPNGYILIAFDYGGGPLNAAIADLVTPEPMA